MTFNLRRVITGHDEAGLAIVHRDEIVAATERLPGYFASTVWCTSEFPVDNDRDDPQPAGGGPGQVLLRIGEMRADQPASHGMHRTQTLDFAVILSGECEMRLDSGETVQRLKAGDVIVQRGTNHSWVPIGDEPCRFLFVLVPAKPVRVGDHVLPEDVSAFAGKIDPTRAA